MQLCQIHAFQGNNHKYFTSYVFLILLSGAIMLPHEYKDNFEQRKI